MIKTKKIKKTLLIDETIDIKLENCEITSYICGKRLNSLEDSSAMKERSKKKANVKEQV